MCVCGAGGCVCVCSVCACVYSCLSVCVCVMDMVGWSSFCVSICTFVLVKQVNRGPQRAACRAPPPLACRGRAPAFRAPPPSTTSTWDVARTYNNIAIVYRNQGKYDAALVEYQKSLDIKIRVFGYAQPGRGRCFTQHC